MTGSDYFAIVGAVFLAPHMSERFGVIFGSFMLLMGLVVKLGEAA